MVREQNPKSWNAHSLILTLVNFHPPYMSEVQCHFSGAPFPDQPILQVGQCRPYDLHPLCTLYLLSTEASFLKLLVAQTVNHMCVVICFCVSCLHTQKTSINVTGLNDCAAWTLKEGESTVGLKSLWRGETRGG